MPRSLSGHAQTEAFRQLAGKTSNLPPKLKAALRKRIRDAAQVAAADAQNTVRNAPTKGSQSTGLREDIARGIKVTVATGQTAGVVIRSTTNNQAHPGSVVKAFDRASGWRHRVFGNDVWAPQEGHPYFASVISKHRDAVTKAVLHAMSEAGDTLK